MLVLGKMFLGAQAPTTDASHSDNETQNYTGSISTDIEPIRGAVANHSLTSLNRQSESQQSEANTPIGSPAIEPGKPYR